MGNILKLNRKLALDKLSKICKSLFGENCIDYHDCSGLDVLLSSFLLTYKTYNKEQ